MTDLYQEALAVVDRQLLDVILAAARHPLPALAVRVSGVVDLDVLVERLDLDGTVAGTIDSQTALSHT